jgi:hypothetical protein
MSVFVYAFITRVVCSEVNNVFTIPTWTLDDEDPYLVRWVVCTIRHVGIWQVGVWVCGFDWLWFNVFDRTLLSTFLKTTFPQRTPQRLTQPSCAHFAKTKQRLYKSVPSLSNLAILAPTTQNSLRRHNKNQNTTSRNTTSRNKKSPRIKGRNSTSLERESKAKQASTKPTTLKLLLKRQSLRNVLCNDIQWFKKRFIR